MLAGASLLVWIAMQLALLQVFFFLQPVIAVIGVVEDRPCAVVARTMPARRGGRRGHDRDQGLSARRASSSMARSVRASSAPNMTRR